MINVTLQLGEDLTKVLEALDQPIEQTARELIVLELYRQQRISSGKAAELLGVSKTEFIKHASDLGIPYIDMSQAAFDQELSEVEKITLEHGR